MAKRSKKPKLPYLDDKKRVVQHGELHDKESKRWCKVHLRWIKDDLKLKWSKHLMCDVVKDAASEKKPRGHGLRKIKGAASTAKEMSKKNSRKSKRTSGVVHYCSKHGKFIGYQWGGHRRRCPAKETSQQRWDEGIAKIQAKETSSRLADDRALAKINEKLDQGVAKIDFQDFSQREAFWVAMRRIGVTGGMFQEKFVGPVTIVGFRVSAADPKSSLKVDDFITMIGPWALTSPAVFIQQFFGSRRDGFVRLSVIKNGDSVSNLISVNILQLESKDAPMAESIPNPPTLMQGRTYPMPSVPMENRTLEKVFRVLGIKKATFTVLSCFKKAHRDGKEMNCPAIQVHELYENSVLVGELPPNGYIVEVNNINHFTPESFAQEVISCMKHGGLSLSLGVSRYKFGKYSSDIITVNIPSLEQAFEEEIFVPVDEIVFKVKSRLHDLDSQIMNQKDFLQKNEKDLKAKREEADALAVLVSKGAKEVQQLEAIRKDFVSKVGTIVSSK